MSVAPSKKGWPFGWEVDVAILEGLGTRGKRTFHYRCCSRSDAKTKALLRSTDRMGQRISPVEVLDVRPVSEEEWLHAYGLGKM